MGEVGELANLDCILDGDECVLSYCISIPKPIELLVADQYI